MAVRNDAKKGDVQAEWERLFDLAVKQPGVAEVLKLYEAAELVYAEATVQPQPAEFITSSANSPLVRKA